MDVIKLNVRTFIDNFINDINQTFSNYDENRELQSHLVHLEKRGSGGTIGAIFAIIVFIFIMFCIIFCCTQCMKSKPNSNTVAPYPQYNGNQMMSTQNGYQQAPYPPSDAQLQSSYPYPQGNNLPQINTTAPTDNTNSNGSNPYLNGQYAQHCMNDNNPSKPNTFAQLFPEFSNNNNQNSINGNNGSITPVPHSYQPSQYSNQGYYSDQGYGQQVYPQNYQGYSQNYPQGYQQDYYQSSYSRDKSTQITNNVSDTSNTKKGFFSGLFSKNKSNNHNDNYSQHTSSKSSLNNQNSIGGNSNDSDNGGSDGGDSGGDCDGGDD